MDRYFDYAIRPLFLTLIHCIAVKANLHDLVVVCNETRFSLRCLSAGKEKRRNDKDVTRLFFGHEISKSHRVLSSCEK